MDFILFRLFRTEKRKKMTQKEKIFSWAQIGAGAWTVYALTLNYFVTGHILAKDFDHRAETYSWTEWLGVKLSLANYPICMVVIIIVLLTQMYVSDEQHRAKNGITDS